MDSLAASLTRLQLPECACALKGKASTANRLVRRSFSYVTRTTYSW